MSSDRPGYLISAPWRSSGKTLLTIGLGRAALRRQLPIQTFKKGPDYIDPLWLAAASGTGCYNLDPYIQSEGELLATFDDHTGAQSLALVEGTMGLHDGLSSDGSDSNAAIAVKLDLPVVLIVDCRGMHRTVAALINGIHQFDPTVRFAGIVLNRVRSSRHEQKITTALDSFCDVPLLGVVPETPDVRISEQELGLTPAPDFDRAEQCIDSVAELVSDNCNLDTLFKDVAPATPQQLPAAVSPLQTSQSESALTDTGCRRQTLPPANRAEPTITAFTPASAAVESQRFRIGLARDEAFHFYYRDDLDRIQAAGAELVEVSPLHDARLSDLDGLIIGGGFPERHAGALAANRGFRESLRIQIDRGLAVHAECAGLMYLCRSMVLDEGQFAMVGCIAGDVRMRRKPVGRGYVRLRGYCEDSAGADSVVNAHEFHHSEIEFDSEPEFMYQVVRGHGVNGSADGIRCGNVHASYAHFRHTSATPWVDRFLRRVAAALEQRSVSAQTVRIRPF